MDISAVGSFAVLSVRWPQLRLELAAPRVGGPKAQRSGAVAPGVPWLMADTPRSPRGNAGRAQRGALLRGCRTFVSAKRVELSHLICVFMDDVSANVIRCPFGKG